MCTVGTELLPAIDLTTGMQENTVALGGFFADVALMFALQILLPEYNYRRKPLWGWGWGVGLDAERKWKMEQAS
jgi:hypothetical protein